MSRSSSVSTKDKSGQPKRSKPVKQRRDDSDSFDSRSQYTPYFPTQQAPTWVSAPPYAPMGPQQFNGGVQPVYPNSMGTQFVPPNMPFNQNMMNTGNMQGYGVPQVSNHVLLMQRTMLTSFTSFLSKVSLGFHRFTTLLLQLMAHLFNHRQLHLSSGSNRTCISPNLPTSSNRHPFTKPEYLQEEGFKARFHISMVSCQTQLILPIQRVNTQFQEALTAMLLIQRHNHLCQEAPVFQFRNQCPTMDLLTTVLLTMAPHISLTMHILPHNNNSTMEQDSAWRDRVPITRYLRTTFLLTWPIDL